MNLRGEQLLAGPGFAEQQDGGVGERDLAELDHHALNGRALPDDGLLTEAVLGLAPQVLVLGRELVLQTLDLSERGGELLRRSSAGPARR